jgi:nucleolar GTP-binding protein
MNFQTLPPVENSKVLLNYAFRKAREKSSAFTIHGDLGKGIKKKECLKIDVIKDVLCSRIEKIQRDFPDLEKLPRFYFELMNLTLDVPLLMKSFGALKWAADKIRFFQKTYASKITKEQNRFRIGSISKEFYGRISSVLKQIDSNLKFLEESRRVMKDFPDIKDIFTVCIYGFPNVGKTTLLNKLTGTKAVVANYSFTTKSINAGYFKVGENKVQVLDVPGTLARPEKMNLIELQAELVLKELAKVIIFVFDASNTTQYTIEKQEQLLKKLGKDKKILVYVSKQDLLSSEELAQVNYKLYSAEEIREEIAKLVEEESKL